MSDELHVTKASPLPGHVAPPQGGWCPGTAEPGRPPMVGTLHAFEDIGQGWTRCARCGARQRVPWAGNPHATTEAQAMAVKALTDALTATRDRLAQADAEVRELREQRDRFGRDVLDLQIELAREREDRREASRRVRELEAEAPEREVILMRVRWGNRLLGLLTVLGMMGLFKLWAWLF